MPTGKARETTPTLRTRSYDFGHEGVPGEAVLEQNITFFEFLG
jgi:hypothetical protein